MPSIKHPIQNVLWDYGYLCTFGHIRLYTVYVKGATYIYTRIFPSSRLNSDIAGNNYLVQLAQ